MQKFAVAKLAAPLLIVGLSQGCGGESDELTGKAAYDQAAVDLEDGIGVMSIYLPYLEVPKKEGKYDPRPTARDVQPRQERAANAIRMAAAGIRQFAKSPVIKTLHEPLANVGRACTRAEGDEAIKKCKDAVLALDAELEKLAAEGSKEGATTKFPRIGPDAINEHAKKEFAPYRRALGPTPKEVVVLKALEDPKADINQLIMDCDAAAEESKAVHKTYEGVDEDLRKLAVKHLFAVEAICRAIKYIEKERGELKLCENEEYKEKEEAKCVLACTRSKNLIKKGLVSAAQEDFPAYYKEQCEEEEQ